MVQWFSAPGILGSTRLFKLAIACVNYQTHPPVHLYNHAGQDMISYRPSWPLPYIFFMCAGNFQTYNSSSRDGQKETIDAARPKHSGAPRLESWVPAGCSSWL